MLKINKKKGHINPFWKDSLPEKHNKQVIAESEKGSTDMITGISEPLKRSKGLQST